MTGAGCNYRLIMFIGPPGAGKSILSRWLQEHLVHHGVLTTLLTEEEVYQLDALQAFAHEWNRTDPGAIRTLLDAIRLLCAGWHVSGTVWITDQFLPAFHWLWDKYPPEHVQAYLDALAPILAPFHPLLISLEADVHVAWHRAVAERGQSWSDWMVEVFKGRALPQNPDGPPQNVHDLLQYFVEGQRRSRALLARLPVDNLVLDTTTAPADQLKAALLQRIGVVPAPRSTGESQ
jgi:adenylate kinase family enzyme